ncbi:MAG: hypothetical protein WCE68_05150 [Anaerolineales bacterium]
MPEGNPDDPKQYLMAQAIAKLSDSAPLTWCEHDHGFTVILADGRITDTPMEVARDVEKAFRELRAEEEQVITPKAAQSISPHKVSKTGRAQGERRSGRTPFARPDKFTEEVKP